MPLMVGFYDSSKFCMPTDASYAWLYYYWLDEVALNKSLPPG